MTFTYTDFYLSGYNTGSLVSGIQAKTPLYCIVTGLKYGGSPVTTGHYAYFTGVFIGASGNLTADVSGYLGFSSDDDYYRGIIVIDDTSGLHASGCLELYWNSGDINTSTGIVLPSGFELFNNFDQTAWNIVTKKNGSINNADSQHTHSAYAQYLRDLDDVGLPAAIDDGDALIYNAASGGWTTGAGGGDPDDWTAVSGEVAEITGTVYDYTVFSGAFSVTSGAVADYPTLSGSYSSLSGAISDYSFVSGSHAALSGDYNAVSGVIDDYVVFSGAFSALSGTLPGHISDNNAHHRPTKINDTPTNGETTTGASSNWAYDHKVIFETASGALNTMSGAVADYPAVSGDYVLTSGDYVVTSGAYVTHAANSAAHHTAYTDADVEGVITAELVNGQSIDNAIDALIPVAGDFGHDDIANPQGNANEQHLTAAQVAALHAAVVAGDLNHNDLANLNAGDVYEHISAAQLAALHTAVVAGDLSHNSLANIDVGDVKHITAAQLGALHSDVIVSIANVESVITDKVGEQSAAFPGAPSEGDLHYDEDDDSLYRYNAEAEAWIEVGASGVASLDNLGNHTATEDLNMDTNKILNVVDPTTDQGAATRITARHGIASDDLIFSNDAETIYSSNSYQKKKEITVHRTTRLRVYWEAHRETGDVTASATRVYINGVAQGSEHSNNTDSYVAFTEDVEVHSGDLLQIYGYAYRFTEPDTYVAKAVYTRYMRIKFIEYVSTVDY